VAVSVFGWKEGKRVPAPLVTPEGYGYPLRVTPLNGCQRVINLALLFDENQHQQQHYCWIKNFKDVQIVALRAQIDELTHARHRVADRALAHRVDVFALLSDSDGENTDGESHSEDEPEPELEPVQVNDDSLGLRMGSSFIVCTIHCTRSVSDLVAASP
jgi:hypothetical protein